MSKSTREKILDNISYIELILDELNEDELIEINRKLESIRKGYGAVAGMRILERKERGK